ncbi:MAG: hypothetical protein ACK53L_33565, partial [Pirellulaceae bacterium]
MIHPSVRQSKLTTAVKAEDRGCVDGEAVDGWIVCREYSRWEWDYRASFVIVECPMVSCNPAKSRPSKLWKVTGLSLPGSGYAWGGRGQPKVWGWCLGVMGYLCLSTLQAGMTIHLTLSGDGLTSSQADAFQSAKRFWEERLVGYQPGITLSGVNISGSSSFIDGLGGTVGEAAPQVTTV